MAVEAPSNSVFEIIGKIFFYGLILPALCYYLWQGLKAIFSFLTEEGDTQTVSPEEDGATVEEQGLSNKVDGELRYRTYRRVELNDESVYREEETSQNVISSENLQPILQLKNTVAEKSRIAPEPIYKIEVFRKGNLYAIIAPSDQTPTDLSKVYICVHSSDKNYTYYFELIKGKTDLNNPAQVGREDTVLEAKQKISQKVYGRSDGQVRLILKANHRTLDNEGKVGDYFGTDKTTFFSLILAKPWHTTRVSTETPIVTLTFK